MPLKVQVATKSPRAETERLSIICMPSVASNGGANTWPENNWPAPCKSAGIRQRRGISLAASESAFSSRLEVFSS